MATTIRGEVRCFSCSRYLGDFESHPEQHGNADIHLLRPEFGALSQHAIETEDGLRCSHCGGRAVLDYMERVAA